MNQPHDFRVFQLPFSLDDKIYYNRRRYPPPAISRAPQQRREFVDDAIRTIDQIIRPTCLNTNRINPMLIFKIPAQVKTYEEDGVEKSIIDIVNLKEFQEKCRFNILGVEYDGTVIIFSQEEGLELFKNRLRDYGSQAKQLTYYDRIMLPRKIFPEERTGTSIEKNPLSDNLENVDIYLWYFGMEEAIISQTLQYIDNIQQKIVEMGGDVLERVILEEYPIIKASINLDILNVLLEEPCIRIIERTIHFQESLKIENFAIDSSFSFVQPDSDIGILILDEAIVPGNPFIAQAIQEHIDLPGATYDDISFNHGTAVSAFALYGDLLDIINSPERVFNPVGNLYFASVYDPAKDLVNEVYERLNYFITSYPNIKVVNLSISTGEQIDSKKKQTYIAGLIDNYLYNLAKIGRELIIVTSIGNYFYTGPVQNTYSRQFRARILDLVENRVTDPATSALSITVGSICLGFNQSEVRFNESSLCKEYFPSLITRVGPGVNDGFKPEFVEFGSDAIQLGRGSDAGIITIDATQYGPFRFEQGTSFSAAIVTNKVADLWKMYPELNANSIKCLLALGANFHHNFLDFLDLGDSQFKKLKPDDFYKILNIFGYGRIDISKSKYSQESWVVLLRENQLRPGKFDVFDIPLPDEFFTSQGNRSLIFSIAYDPPTKPSRKDYLGLEIDYFLFRNLPKELIQKYYEKVIASGDSDDVGDTEGNGALDLQGNDSSDESVEGEMSIEDLLSLDINSKINLKRIQKYIYSHEVPFYPSKNLCKNVCLRKHQYDLMKSTTALNEFGLKLLVLIKYSSSKWFADMIDSTFTQRYSVVVGAESEVNISLRTRIREKIQLRVQPRITS